MKKLHYEIIIDAPVKKVWETMLEDRTYRLWTEPFTPGSHYVGSWEKGSKILFLGPDPNSGKESGMVARIAENKPYEFISIQHYGLIQDGTEDTSSAAVKAWGDARENYTFEDLDDKTKLLVEVDSDDQFVKMFEGTWPKALEKLKELSEA